MTTRWYRVLRAFFAVIAALWIFLEESLWNVTHACMAWFGTLPGVRWCEGKIARLSSYAALVAFLIPALIMLPFKFVGFWLIAHHHSGLGLAIFIVAKVVGTAFLARIFELTKPALLGIEWFQKLYLRLSTWRDQLYAYVRSFRAWRMANAWITNARVALRALVRTGLGNRVLYELWDEQSLATKVATINIVAVTAFVIVKAIFG